MLPADLAVHRARRNASGKTALERDAARLAPRLDKPEDRRDLRALCDAARAGAVPLDQAHAQVRDRISQLDQAA